MKMSRTSGKYIKTLLLCLCIFFAWALWMELSRDYSLPRLEQMTDKPEASISSTDQDLVLPLLSDYAAIIERPLFIANRQPYVEDETDVETKKPVKNARDRRKIKDNFLLSAVIITNEKRIALIRSGRGRKIQKVYLGEAIDDWTLTDVQTGEISLSKGNEVKKLALLVKSSPKLIALAPGTPSTKTEASSPAKPPETAGREAKKAAPAPVQPVSLK